MTLRQLLSPSHRQLTSTHTIQDVANTEQDVHILQAFRRGRRQERRNHLPRARIRVVRPRRQPAQAGASQLLDHHHHRPGLEHGPTEGRAAGVRSRGAGAAAHQRPGGDNPGVPGCGQRKQGCGGRDESGGGGKEVQAQCEQLHQAVGCGLERGQGCCWRQPVGDLASGEGVALLVIPIILRSQARNSLEI